MMRTRPSLRAGFTLWELTMVLLVMAIGAALVAPAYARLGSEQPSTAADKIIGLLRDSRKVAVDNSVTATLRLDPKTLNYRLDTTGAGGTSTYASGTLDMGLTETLADDQARLEFMFRPTGAAFADTVVVHGADIPWIVRVDPWSGVARADSR
ncbi:MAG TPA: prepilin-type N-terminal cleavage/methylation domain-containing protein [Gemmatimonadaceae bacterium]|jgi:prepilin-type N-terminal cleavage/methylation domain-containing protein